MSERGEPCRHTEHAVRGGVGYVGRFWPDPRMGGEGKWEPCPNEPSYGAVARAEALAAGFKDWHSITTWDPTRTQSEVER